MFVSLNFNKLILSFGYGFDRVDVADLLHDALGIAAAMIVAKICVKR